MSENDKLRGWQSAIENLTEEALAASKPEPLPDGCAAVQSGPCVAGACVCKPEPQAQAAEPEVVAYRTRLHRMSGAEYWGYNDRNPFPGLPNSGEPLITLQSHREAMASLKQSAVWWARAAERLEEAIAKRDAALKACVEALEMILEFPNTGPATSACRAAITQAKGAQG